MDELFYRTCPYCANHPYLDIRYDLCEPAGPGTTIDVRVCPECHRQFDYLGALPAASETKP